VWGMRQYGVVGLHFTRIQSV